MHRVLFLRDILLDIFGHCSPARPLDENYHLKADLAVLARTCQAFKEPALDVLWEELFDLSPLARCLPEACEKVVGRCYLFNRPLSEAEWNTLRGYTRRVRSIHHSLHARDDRILLLLAPFTRDPLFPKLRSLYWGNLKTLPVAHIAVPSLTSLSLSSSVPSGSLPPEFLDTIGECCPNIRQLKAFYSPSRLLDAIISRQLCRWSNLRYVDCHSVTLSMDVILHLPSLSTLRQLSFTLSADLGNHITHLGSAFVLSNLADLHIKSTSLKSVTALFSRIQLPKVKDLSVSVSEYTPRWDVQEYWTTVQRACPPNTITRLVFSSLFGDRSKNLPSLDEHRHPCLMLHDLLPYKDFGNLRKIGIDVAWSVNLTDADLLDLVSTSPQLEELSINNFWGWKMDSEGGITLSGLVQLLRQCPSLCIAALVIDMRTFTQIPRGMDVSFPPRKTFRGTLALNCLDSHFVPEFNPEYRTVFKALKLRVWSSFDSYYSNTEETQDSSDE